MGGTITDIGSRRKLLADDFLIEQLNGGASQVLHHPVPREESLILDRPWEGNMCGFITVFRDGPVYKMYYKAWAVDLAKSSGENVHMPHGCHIAYAESSDGIRWERPSLGIIEFEGSRDNNIVWDGATDTLKGLHGFSPFKDDNPACPPEARYKAVGAAWESGQGLFAMQSPDGLHWSLFKDDPILYGYAFDSQNLAFWDAHRGEYRAYIRHTGKNWFRKIMTATSPDFVNWTIPQWLEYPGSPEEQLYTNQVTPYPRAPHLFVGFPTRYVPRPWSPSIEALPELEHRKLRASVNERFGTALTDGLFMISRDGRTFTRRSEAFLRPGLRTARGWAYGDCYQCWGLVETDASLPDAPPELSFYAPENYWREPATIFRRYSIRADGFVSVKAPLAGGEMVTNPLVFSGSRLSLNVSTSAAGSMRVEIQDIDGRPLPGFSLDECWDVIGDTLDYTVRWQNGTDVSEHSGKPVKLRFVLSDADLFAFQFARSARFTAR